VTVFTSTASNPSFTRMLRRRWGADLKGLKPDTVTSKELFGIVEQQAALVQQLVEELASFMGTSSTFTQYAPQIISYSPSTIERSADGTVPGGPGQDKTSTTSTSTVKCREGNIATLTVENPDSEWDEEKDEIRGGMSGKFDGVASFDVICANAIYVDHIATHIAFQLPLTGFGPEENATVLDYYDGFDPDPESLGVSVLDPYNLFVDHIPFAKGKAVWDPNDKDYIAVEAQTVDVAGGIGVSQHIAFQLPPEGFGLNDNAIVLEYFGGDDPDPDDEGVSILDPAGLFPDAIWMAKGKAFWATIDGKEVFIAVEAETGPPVVYSPCLENNYNPFICQAFVHGPCSCAPDGERPYPLCPIDWCDLITIDVYVRFEMKADGLYGYKKKVTVITNDTEEEALIFATTDCA